MNIENSVFLVTGGGSGLGAATAKLLASKGGKIVVTDVNDQAVQAVAAEIGASAKAIAADVTQEAPMQAAVDLAVKTFGGLHGAISCAGVAPGERVLGKTGPHRLDSFRRTIDINVIGTFNTLRLAAAAMANNTPSAEGERGVIINTASIAAWEGQIGQAAYGASKAAVVGMALPVARELARIGIRVVTIAPGIFDTPMLAAMSAETRASLAAQIPFPSRLGQPEDYARLAAFIVENTMLNAEVIRLDGAIRMGAK
ncbi:MAG: SDR family NAD(P)-dependent oxidoreductase [Burkholderiales bacterium]